MNISQGLAIMEYTSKGPKIQRFRTLSYHIFLQYRAALHDYELSENQWPPQSPYLNPIDNSTFGMCCNGRFAEMLWCNHVNMDQDLKGMFPTPC